MRSQQTFSLLQSAKEIRVAIKSDGERIGGMLNEQQPLPVEEGEPAFDYGKHMQHLNHQLDLAAAGVVVAEDDHSTQKILVSRLQDSSRRARDSRASTSVGASRWPTFRGTLPGYPTS